MVKRVGGTKSGGFWQYVDEERKSHGTFQLPPLTCRMVFTISDKITCD